MQFYHPLKAILFVAILPNIALIILAIWFDLNRPYVNLDYLFVSLLTLTRLRWLGIAFFILLFAIDLFVLAGQIFLFIRPDNLLYLIKFLPETSSAYQFGIIGLVILLVLLTYVQLSIPKVAKPLHTLVIFNIALILYAMNVYGSGDPQERIWRVQSSPLVDSQLLFLLDNRSDGFLQSFISDGPALSNIKVSGASADWFNTEKADSKKNLMLIASESWGVPLNHNIQQALLAPLTNLNRKIKHIDSGQFNFSGPTLAAELRELCQLDAFHYNLKDVTNGFENCLPNKLKQSGYKTYAMHGATGVMYDRIYWYPRAGFESSTFFETQVWPRRCFSFPGACDIDMIETASKALSSSDPTFLYWLTLNSHSVYDTRDIHIDLFDCENFNVDPTTQSCRNLKLHAQFFYSLAKSIEAGNFAGVEVVIVGDHTPIITSPEEKAAYFVDQKVPWIKFSVEHGNNNALVQNDHNESSDNIPAAEDAVPSNISAKQSAR
ncbi:sulfatase-like hydrolase/transferase [Rheinheimera maricola]|uniref:Sulfatase-like hydrolase/transferase n=1 Tax=Rheinheimera maricola TaxID=2793282 RepID=A0ABS7X859_9GAMM|nr:sulfatase-like hydrolase/transferase [Rheinheimera maricola]MBZ9611345.1 sulfatase-like hydrolase/transferase [Rheinheimera maricola]